MHSWFAQSGSRPCPWSASRRAALERRSLEGRIYAVPPCRGNAVQYDHGGATIGDLSGTRRFSKPLPHTPPMVPTFMTEGSRPDGCKNILQGSVLANVVRGEPILAVEHDV